MGPRWELPILGLVLALVCAVIALPGDWVLAGAAGAVVGAVVALAATWRCLPAPAQRLVAQLVRARVRR